jgi:para-aminobenzoate synthetase / 4-amino-4-deoxychorismate lyase
MRWEPGRGLLGRDRHRCRLLDSGALLGFDLDPARLDAVLDRWDHHQPGAGAGVTDRLDQTPGGCGPLRVRLVVDAAGACEVEATAAGARGTPERPLGPWRASLAARPVRDDDLFCRHKTTHRVAYDQARREDGAAGAPVAADELVCWNAAGRLTETTIGNLVLELDGALVTPAESAGLLPGTARAALLADGTVVEADLAVEDLGRASRVWMVNAVRGWVALELVGSGLSGGTAG